MGWACLDSAGLCWAWLSLPTLVQFGLVWFGLDWARLRMVGHGCVALGSTALGWVLLELAGLRSSETVAIRADSARLGPTELGWLGLS